MRLLAFSPDSFPEQTASGYVLLHQSMALEELGHEVHLYNLRKPLLGLADYLDAYEFDLILIDPEQLRAQDLREALRLHRRREAVRVVATLYSLPAPPEAEWDIADFTVTPWKGEAIDRLARHFDIRHLPLGYNATLHHRHGGIARELGPVFAGDTTGPRRSEAESYLESLQEERVVLCIGPDFEQKALDPFILGRIYASARCAPNFHYSWEKGENRILNERFWQAARCGVPVNDSSPLMEEVWDAGLREHFCFADRQDWQQRIRELNAGAVSVHRDVLALLDASLAGHSYHDRMRQLLEWIA